MMTSLINLAMNPFDDDIVREPRDVTFSVQGLNDKQLNYLATTFETLEAGEPPRRPVRSPRAQLVISPNQGYGKSHLLGRLLRTLGARATQVYLRPFQDPYKAWHSILLLTIQELERPPELSAPPTSSSRSISQLEALAISVLFHLAAGLLASGQFPDYDDAAKANSLLRNLASDPTCLSEKYEPWIEWLNSLIAEPNRLWQLASILKGQGIKLGGKEQAWLKVLAACAFSAPVPAKQETALKWIRAEPLESEEVTLLGMASADNEGRGDSSAQEINDLSFRRLREMCLLSSYYRPFLFCFDQTEFFASDGALINAFGNCIDKLFAEVPNQMTVITANDGNWRKEILPQIESPQRDRLSPEIKLDGISTSGATELITSRLREYDLGDADIIRFFADGWLNSVFGQLPELGVRDVLKQSAGRFRRLAKLGGPPSAQTLSDLFQLQINDVRSKKALLAYNQDALMWFTRDIDQYQANVSIARPANRKYFSIEWSWPNRSVYFAFEGGDNSQRWRGIANEAIRIANDRGDRSVLCYVFRTPDLAKVPRSTWIAIGATIKEAARKGLCIFALTLDEVCELHAARELYSNALQGNIAFSGSDTLAWLRSHFEPLLKDLTNRQLPPDAANEESNVATTRNDADREEQGKMSTKLDETNLKVLVYTVREMRLVDIKVVLSRLGSNALRDSLLRSVEAHPNLKAHPGPQTTFLQWRIAQ